MVLEDRNLWYSRAGGLDSMVALGLEIGRFGPYGSEQLEGLRSVVLEVWTLW